MTFFSYLWRAAVAYTPMVAVGCWVSVVTDASAWEQLSGGFLLGLPSAVVTGIWWSRAERGAS